MRPGLSCDGSFLWRPRTLLLLLLLLFGWFPGSLAALKTRACLSRTTN